MIRNPKRQQAPEQPPPPPPTAPPPPGTPDQPVETTRPPMRRPAIRDYFRLPTKPHAPACPCPQCSLAKLVRPRYFSGQLLTDDDLRTEQDYQIAKDRLQNRYLHGTGVVCGLEIVCHDCDDDKVTIQPGYAIGPCGEDIVVPAPYDLDVIAEIARCQPKRKCDDDRHAHKRGRDNCDEGDQHWCITLAYHETHMTPKAVLNRACANGERSHCEHSRVCEDFEVGIADRTCLTCDDSSLAASEFGKAYAEVRAALVPVIARVGGSSWSTLQDVAFGRTDGLGTAAVYNANAALKGALCDLFAANPLGVPCPPLRTVKEIYLPDPPRDDAGDLPASQDWMTTQQGVTINLATALFAYLWDWFCHKLLPPCPPEPCDDFVVLGCVTVNQGRVVDVCNFSCRTRAGSFPARKYWWSLSGVRPVFLMILEFLCCFDLISARSPVRNQLVEVMRRLDPDGSVREAISASDFGGLRNLLADLDESRDRISGDAIRTQLRERLAPAGGDDASVNIGRPAGNVADELAEAGVNVIVKDATSAPAFRKTRAPRLNPGDDVVLVRHANTGRVLGFERAPRDPPEVAELRTEIEQLRAELAEVKEAQAKVTRAPAKKAPAKKAPAKKAPAKKPPARKRPASGDRAQRQDRPPAEDEPEKPPPRKRAPRKPRGSGRGDTGAQ